MPRGVSGQSSIGFGFVLGRQDAASAVEPIRAHVVPDMRFAPRIRRQRRSSQGVVRPPHIAFGACLSILLNSHNFT
jgi:hypothetical protein